MIMKMQMKRKFFLTALLVVAFGLFFTACRNLKNKNSTQEATSSKETKPQQTKTFEKVTFVNEEGEEVNLGSLKGKVVFINFWATWCPPCKKELPSIQVLRESFKDNSNIVFLMVDIDGTMKESTAYMQENNLDLPVYIPKGRIPSAFLGNAVPTTVILNKKGEIAARTVGAGDYSKPEVKEAINQLIADK